MLFKVGRRRTPQVYGQKFIQKSNTRDGNPPRLINFGDDMWKEGKGLRIGLRPVLNLPNEVTLRPTSHYADYALALRWLCQHDDAVWEAYLTGDDLTEDMQLTVAFEDQAIAGLFAIHFR